MPRVKSDLLIARAPKMQHWAAFVLMVLSLTCATEMTPKDSWYARLGRPDYDQIVPHQFGNWMDMGASTEVVSPLEADAIKSTYSQTVTRTYLEKSSGRVIMLSLAYGDVQQGVTQMHRPEACYSSQGFNIVQVRPEQLRIGDLPIDGFRMTAVLGNRKENVTYWIRMGDEIVGGSAYTLNLTRMSMGLKGVIADGLLFRVSELGKPPSDSNELQDEFIADLLHALTPAQQLTLVGRPTVKS